MLLPLTLSTVTQQGIVVGGGDMQNISYTIGGDLIELQIAAIEDVSLGVAHHQFETPIDRVVSKRKTLIEKIVEFIKKNN